MTIRGASSVMEPPLLTVTDEGPTAVTAPPGVISTSALPSSARSCVFPVCTAGDSLCGWLRTPTRAKPSERSCIRGSIGSPTPPDCHHASMQREANTTRHSSPEATGKVNVKPPPPGKTTGTSGRRGMFTEDVLPVSSVTRPATAGCTVTVMATGSKDWMIPGSAVHISACLPSRAARCASTGSSCRSRLSIIAGPKEDAWCRQCRCRRDRRTSRCRACRP